jgi:S1-C subfamily serine protease
MRWSRPPDWSVYGAIVVGLLLAALYPFGRQAPRARPGETAGFSIGPATPFDPKVVAATDARGAGAGTAFSIDSRGVWLTARHVVEGCRRVVVVTGAGRGVAARSRLDPSSESALLFTSGGAPALTIAPLAELERGTLAYHSGFPKGRPGEVASRLLRRETLVLPHRSEPVLAWVEVGHSPFLFGSLAGLSGAPALDAQGRVIAVTVAQAPRRRRVYTTTPTALAAFLGGFRRSGSDGGPSALHESDYHAMADRLRGVLSIAQVVCLDG